MLAAHLAIVAFAPAPLARPAVLNRAAPACMSALADEPALESSCSFDFVPLITALKTAEFREADQLTRDALIKLAGDAAVRRGYVYFSEVPNLPKEDLGTIDRLWRTYSGDKFGYSVQAEIFESKKVSGNFDRFFERIGWTNGDGSLLRWLPEAAQDEFVYDVDKAVKGHLPLTSALRGTQLLQGLMTHPAWSDAE